MVPMARDLRFAWQEMPQQVLDVQAQKVRESLQAALIAWAESAGGGTDYTDNLPLQCLHPVGHWFEVANLLRNGTLARLLAERPALKYLMLHNIDTLGADLDPAAAGRAHRHRRLPELRGDSAADRRPGRRLGPRRRPGAAARGPRLAPRGRRVPLDLLQLDDHLDRHRALAAGLQALARPI